MRTRLRGSGAVGALLLASVLVAGVAVADQPGITINTIPNLQYASYPQVYNVTGTVFHDTGSDSGQTHVCALNAMKVVVDDGGGAVTLLDQGNPGNHFNWNCGATTANWNTNWSITGPGNYTITATIKHQSAEGTDNESVIVTTLTVDHPAAPAVAAALLKAAGVDPRYGKGKDGGNCIAEVAHAMGPETDFNGVEKSSVQAYEDAVRAFLNASAGACAVGGA